MYSEQHAVSDGTMSFIDVSLDYLDRSEISVLFNDVGATGWSWSGTVENRILFSPNVPNGTAVTVLRTTGINGMRHVFAGGAAFRKDTMDEDMRQLLHAIQELREHGTGGGGGGGGGPVSWWDVTNKPYASAGIPGIVKVGAGLAIDVNGVLRATGGGGGGGTPVRPLRIVVVGDSLTGTQPLLAPAWPEHLERLIRHAGLDVEVINLGINGWTFHRANVTPSFGTKTVRDKAIELNADIYLMALGLNDTIGASGPVDARTLAQVQSDASAFVAALAAGVPTANIVHIRQTPYDHTHGTVGALLNRHVIPIHMAKPSAGIMAGCYSSEMQADSIGSTYNTYYTNWVALANHIQGLAGVSTGVVHLWRAVRLGATGYDSLHITAQGHQLLAGGVLKALRGIAALSTKLPGLSSQSFPPFDDLDGMFTMRLNSNGTQWVATTDVSSEHTLRQSGAYPGLMPGRWYFPSKGGGTASVTTVVSGQPFSWSLRNTTPGATVYSSMDGGAWQSRGTTDAAGDFEDIGNLVAPPGTYVFRYKVNNEVFGPIAVVITAAPAAVVPFSPIVASGAALVASPWAYPASTKAYIPLAYAPGTWASTAASRAFVADAGSGKSSIVVAPASGKYMFVRISLTALVTASAGADVLHILGIRVYTNHLGVYLHDVQLDAKYSPAVDYALELTGTFVGKYTQTIAVHPFVFASAAGALSSSAAGGYGTYWSAEIIAEGNL